MILVTEFMAAEGLDLLRSADHTLYDAQLAYDRERLLHLVQAADALVVRNATRVDEQLLRSQQRLRAVGRLGVGLDNVDLRAAHASGVTVVYAPGANAVATAEFTLALILSLLRRLPAAAAAGAAGNWQREAFLGHELAGKVLGVVGLGRVGSAVARSARALGMDVVTCRPPHDDPPDPRHLGVHVLGLEELLRSADCVTLHVPLTSATERFIGRHELALFRPNAYLVNTARGGLVDEAALAVALREGWLAGAALDVREHEPPLVPDPLADIPNLILTPHVAGLSDEAQRLTSTLVARDVIRVLRGEPPCSAVAAPPLERRPTRIAAGPVS